MSSESISKTSKKVIEEPIDGQMTIKEVIEETSTEQEDVSKGKMRTRKRRGLKAHLKSIGFTNRLAVYLLIFLLVGMIMGFGLAIYSIHNNYIGQLLVFTCAFSPIGTCCSIVLNSIVNKSKAENMNGDGTGIKFAAAMSDNFNGNTTDAIPVDDVVDNSYQSPPI